MFILAVGLVLQLDSCAVNAPAITASSGSSVTSKSRSRPLSEHSRAMLAILEGEWALDNGQYALALTAYRRAFEMAPSSEMAQTIILIASRLNEPSIMRQTAEQWVRLEPRSTLAWRALAVIAARNGRVRVARSAFRHYVILHSQTGQAMLKVAGFLGQGVNPAVALKIMRGLNVDFPHQALSNLAVGIVELQFGQPTEALRMGRLAAERDDGLRRAYILQAEALVHLHRVVSARLLLRKVQRRFPNDPDLRLVYGQILIRVHRYQEALTQFHWLIQRYPHHSSLWYTYGLINFHLGIVLRARKAFRQVLENDTSHLMGAEYFLGRLDERQDRLSLALGHYSNVISGPYAFEAHVRIAYILASEGDLAEARIYLHEFRESLHSAKHKVDLYLVEAALVDASGQPRVSVAILSRGLRQFPDNRRLLTFRAAEHLKAGNWKAAVGDWRRIIKLQPRNADALNGLGYVLLEHGAKPSVAGPFIERAFRILPDNPEIIDSMGWLAYHRHQYRKAVTYLRKAYDQSHDSAIAVHLIRAYMKIGWWKRARDLLNHIKNDIPMKQFQNLKAGLR